MVKPVIDTEEINASSQSGWLVRAHIDRTIKHPGDPPMFGITLLIFSFFVLKFFIWVDRLSALEFTARQL